MKKEFFKTMLLYFLVIFAVFLTASIWSGKELWSFDYSSFLHNIKNVQNIRYIFSGDDNGEYIPNTKIDQSDFYAVEWLSLCENSSRNVVYSGEESFEGISNMIEDIKENISRAGTISYVSDSDYKNAFKGNGIGLKFLSQVSLTDYLKCGDDFFDILKRPYVDCIFITVSEDSQAKYLYFHDYKTNQNYRLPIDFNSQKIVEKIRPQIKASSLSDSFSFELNFDKKNEDVERIPVESLVPVTLSERFIYKLSAEILNYDISDSVYDGIFKKFNIKKNSARSYTDNENTISFIESHATLKIYENSSFTYEAGENYDGISVGTSDELTDAVLFVNSLYRDCFDSDVTLSLKNVSSNDGIKEYEFCYTIGSNILSSKEGGDVVMRVKDGNIIYYKQRFINIENTQKYFSVGSLVNAYDAVYNEGLNISKADLQIVSMYPVNVIYEDGSVLQKWCVEFSDGTFEYL